MISSAKRDDYSLFLLGTHRKPLNRQLEEAVIMDRVERLGKLEMGGQKFDIDQELLNSKFEYYRPRTVRLMGR